MIINENDLYFYDYISLLNYLNFFLPKNALSFMSMIAIFKWDNLTYSFKAY